MLIHFRCTDCCHTCCGKRWGLKSESWEKCLCFKNMNESIAPEESQKISAESLCGNSGEFSVMEAKHVKVSSCQKLHRRQRDETETETIDTAIMRLLIDL